MLLLSHLTFPFSSSHLFLFPSPFFFFTFLPFYFSTAFPAYRKPPVCTGHGVEPYYLIVFVSKIAQVESYSQLLMEDTKFLGQCNAVVGKACHSVLRNGIAQ